MSAKSKVRRQVAEVATSATAETVVVSVVNSAVASTIVVAASDVDPTAAAPSTLEKDTTCAFVTSAATAPATKLATRIQKMRTNLVRTHQHH